MSTVKEVDDYYIDNYNRLLNYVSNKKGGGDQVSIHKDASYDVLHDTYMYHRTHPEHFDARYIWNVLKQRRIDYLRGSENYDTLKDDFFILYYTGSQVRNENPLETRLINRELQGIIKGEIRSVANEKSRGILESFFIHGESISDKTNRNDRDVVKRFRKKMIDNYGDIWRSDED